MKQREFSMLAGLPDPRDADEKTLRLCDSEQDAIKVSIQLSGLSQVAIAERMGVAKSFITMLKTGERELASVQITAAFCTATGSNLVRQYRTLQSAYRIAQGRMRETDRIAAIASYTRAA